jgi:hypothetical protein
VGSDEPDPAAAEALADPEDPDDPDDPDEPF